MDSQRKKINESLKYVCSLICLIKTTCPFCLWITSTDDVRLQRCVIVCRWWWEVTEQVSLSCGILLVLFWWDFLLVHFTQLAVFFSSGADWLSKWSQLLMSYWRTVFDWEQGLEVGHLPAVCLSLVNSNCWSCWLLLVLLIRACESGCVIVFVCVLSTEVRLEMRLSCTAQFWFVRILCWHEHPTVTAALLQTEDEWSKCPWRCYLALTW